MITIETIMRDDFKARLEQISIANGYLNDVSVLPGYLVHYVNDLMNPDNSTTFPCVAFQFVTDDVQVDHSGTKSKNARDIKIIGAVDVKVASTVNDRISTLLFDVRRALAMDKYQNFSEKTSLASEINIGRAVFDLPDPKSQYALFELPVEVKYNENWKP